VIHHLEELKKNSPDDLAIVPYDLPNRFLGDKAGEVQKLADSLVYYSVPGSCPASNHDSSDASVTPDGKICFSHKAFKNLTIKDSIRKLISMSMHEISHLRGFDEQDAMRWQLVFDRTEIGDKTILTYNENYRLTRDVLKKVGEKLDYAMKNLLERKKDSKRYACELVAIADDRITDVFYVYQDLPSYLKKMISESIVRPIGQAQGTCLEKSDAELAGQLASALAGMADFSRKLEKYESPICEGELCAGTRFQRGSIELTLLEWKAKKDLFVKSQKYPKVDPASVACELLDFAENKSIELKKNGYGSYDLSFLNPEGASNGLSSLDTENPLFGSDLEGSASVGLAHYGAVQLMESNGFVAEPMFIMGLLAPKVAEKISMKFALMDPKKGAPVENGNGVSTPEIPYSMREAYFFPIKEKPTVLREFQLNCRLTAK
jgi:hypothetical protein